MWYVIREDELYHHGIKGQKWGVRRFQNPDGTLTAAGKKRYGGNNSPSSVYSGIQKRKIRTQSDALSVLSDRDREKVRRVNNAVADANKKCDRAQQKWYASIETNIRKNIGYGKKDRNTAEQYLQYDSELRKQLQNDSPERSAYNKSLFDREEAYKAQSKEFRAIAENALGPYKDQIVTADGDRAWVYLAERLSGLDW